MTREEGGGDAAGADTCADAGAVGPDSGTEGAPVGVGVEVGAEDGDEEVYGDGGDDRRIPGPSCSRRGSIPALGREIVSSSLPPTGSGWTF